MEKVLLKCNSCNSTNKVFANKLMDKPKCGKCSAPLEYPKNVVPVTSQTFKNEVLQSPGVVLVDLWSPTCSHCVTLGYTLEKIATEHAGIIKIVKINAQMEQQLVSQFDIRGVPTLLLYKKGKMVNRTAGAIPKEQLVSWVYSSIQKNVID